MRDTRTVQLFVGYPACHSDPAVAGEESRIISPAAPSNNQRCFAEPALSKAEGLNMTRHEPELELQPPRLSLQ